MVAKGSSALSASASSSSSVTIYPSRLPQGGQPQQPENRRRLQRQKEIDTFFARSTSESLPDNELTAASSAAGVSLSVTSSSSVLTTSQRRQNRPVLQRQQRQSSEESTKSNVHFKEDPEYFEVDNAASIVCSRRAGIYDPVRNVVSEQKKLTATSTSHQQGLANHKSNIMGKVGFNSFQTLGSKSNTN